MEDSQTLIVHPVTLDVDASVVEVVVRPVADHYISTFQTLLYMEFHVERVDGEPITADEDVSFITLPSSSIYNTLEVYVNEKQVVNLGNSDLGYKCYIEHMLSYSDTAINGHLKAAHCVVDTPTKMNLLSRTPEPVNQAVLTEAQAAAHAQLPFQLRYGGNAAFNVNQEKLGAKRKIHILCQPPGDFFAMVRK